MITYINSFYDHFSADTSVLTDLVGQTTFDWKDEHTRAFLKIQQKIKDDLHLNYYDQNLPLHLFTDSSGRTGGGYCFKETEMIKRTISPFYL